MKKSLLFLFLSFSGIGISSAQVLDQQSLPPVGSGWLVNNGSYTTMGQSFTAGITGPLSSVVIHLDNTNPTYPLIAGTFSLTIRDGDGYGGTILGTESFTITGSEPYGDYAISITGAVNVTSGNMYTFIIDETSGTGQIMLNANSNTYAGGILYSSVFNNPPSPFPSWDLLFKTYVNTGCLPTSSSIAPHACNSSYTVPSGDETYTASGTYTDTIPNTGGCDSIITINLTVNNIADQTVTASNNNFCPGDSSLIQLPATENGIVYKLRDDSNNNVLGSQYSTGGAISFNTGQLNNTTTYNVLAENIPLSSVDLPGNNDYIGFNNNPFYTYTNSITVEAYVWFDGTQNPKAGQATYSSDNMGTNVWLWEGGAFYVNDNGTWRSVTFPAIPNGWTHVATVADPTGLYIYYDGSQVAFSPSGITSGILNNSSSVVHLGHDPRFAAGTPGRNTNLPFDNFRIWNSARSQSEISANMQVCLTGTEPDLVQYTKFNEGAGNVINSVTGINGMVYNQSPANWIYGPGFCTDPCTFEMSTLVTITVNQPTSSSISQTSCDSYLSPSGNYTWSTSGVYMDTISNTAGCDSVITVNLTVNTVNATVTNSSPVLSANATGAVYQWVDCNTGFSSISGATSQNFTATADGDYAVIVTQNGCTDTSSCENITGLGFIQDNFNNVVTIFPNPTNGIVTVKTNAASNTVSITDITGRLVMTKETTNNTASFDLSASENGVYFVQVKNGSFTKTIRVVLHH